ncbi:MAG: sugar phosphate isomerase/epimerase [Pirellulaceae bacterium]|nr:sugar phosphate isomerase/epimerase [Pirellulaceae bacterium]
MKNWPIGVFASIDAGLGVQLDIVHELQIPTIHLHAPSKENRTPEKAKLFLEKLASYGITISCVFGGFEGESYADIPTVAETVGLVPETTREKRSQEMKEIADFAKLLGCSVVGLHVGFVPHDTTSDDYADVLRVTQEICDHCHANGQSLHLETGQETVEALIEFLQKVDRKNLHVNFDPANMILYGTGEPLEALEKLGTHVRSIHCKDATWSKNPGVDWGAEVPLGAGDVNIEAYLRLLKKIGYTGPLTIEREIPQEPKRQKEEIGQAVALLQRLKETIC